MEENRRYLTPTEIDNICRDLVEKISRKYPYYKAYINFVYAYGCRIGELFNYAISFNASTNKVEITPQKKNNTRILTPINFEVQKWIEEINLTQDKTYLNKRNLQRIIEKEILLNNLKCGNKKIGCHIFRHNYIKKLVAEGRQISTIDTLMGYTTQTVADTYAISQIYQEIL